MGDNAVNKSFIIEDEDEEATTQQLNTFPDAVKELGHILFEKYPEKTSNLSYDNINGLVMGEVLNEYMEVNFGYRYKTVDRLMKQKQMRVIAYNGFGVEKIIEFVKSIQASFDQSTIPDTMMNRIRGR